MNLRAWKYMTVLVVLSWLSANAIAQRPDRPYRGVEGVVLIVPVAGAGTWDDPKRPSLTVPPSVASGVMTWSWEPSDDGRHAIVQIGARERKSLEPILKNPAVIRSFERGKASKEEIERECRQFRKDFDVDSNDSKKARISEGQEKQ